MWWEVLLSLWWVVRWIFYTFSVELRMLFHLGPRAWRPYEPNLFEKLGNVLNLNIIRLLIFTLQVYMTYCEWEILDLRQLYFVLAVLSSLFVRAFGRATNWIYREFVAHLLLALDDPNNEGLLRLYDFGFWGIPVQFSHEMDGLGFVNFMLTPFSWVLAYIVVRFMYPGMVSSYVASLITGDVGYSREDLDKARGELISRKKAKRIKIESSDGCMLDGFFIDKRPLRNAPRSNGNTLVICFEGNASFAENGIGKNPIREKYSVLIFNRPGFGESTGTPFPKAELAAAEAVFAYSIDRLNFAEQSILLYGWSIGGFPASYLAAMHPDIKGLILDATFSDILPLIHERIPWWIPDVLVINTVKSYLHLKVSHWMRLYRGPVLLIRRTQDDMMSDGVNVGTNLINLLLTEILEQRYAFVFDMQARVELMNYLDAENIQSSGQINRLFSTPVKVDSAAIRRGRGALLVRLAKRMMVDVRLNHGGNLGPGDFRSPSQPHVS